jgi:CheY-like chemotaxis protein
MVSSLKGIRVIVVDDEDRVRDFFADVLRLAGADVRVAASARDALTLIERQLPDVLVSDVMMPQHDGYWLVTAVNAIGPNRPRTLAVTGDPRKHSRDMLLRAGYDAFLSKPIGMETLASTVARLAGRVHPALGSPR